MYQSNRSFNIPPGQPRGPLNFWKILVQTLPPRAEKLIKCPHLRESFQITVLTILFTCKLALDASFLNSKFKRILSKINKNRLKQLQIRNKACVGLWFSTNPPRISNIFLWIYQSLSPPPLHHDLSTKRISATRNLKSRLAIKFPTPCEKCSNALPPGVEKASNARGDVESSIWLVRKGWEERNGRQVIITGEPKSVSKSNYRRVIVELQELISLKLNVS